jgi:hypothetical protein
MKQFKYVPKEVELEDKTKVPSPFVGHLMIKIPLYKERLNLIKEMNLNVDQDDKSLVLDSNKIDQAIKMNDIAKAHIAEMDLKYAATDEKVESVDDLEYLQEGSQLLIEVANMVLSGFKLGNS